jgi:PAS domain S-box-containing protein
MKVKLYVGVVALAAAVAAAAAGLTVPGRVQPSVPVLGLFVVLIAAAEYFQIRYYHHDEVDALNVLEGFLAPLVLFASGWSMVAVCVLALSLGDLTRKNPPLKVVFNTSQWLLSASVATLAIRPLEPGNPRTGTSVAVALMAVLVMSLVNQVALSGVLYVVSGSALGSRDRRDATGVLFGHLASIGGALLTATCLTACYLWSPWTVGVGLLVTTAAYATGRANASLRADGARLAGLQRATHALVASLDPGAAIPEFLTEARTGFEVSEVELVLRAEGRVTVHRSAKALPDGQSSAQETHELAALLMESITAPAHLSVDAGPSAEICFALARTGHSRAVAVPLRRAEQTVGMLLLYDRFGMEGFEAGELVVANALARELVGFFERVDLIRAIDEERQKLTDILESTSDGIFTVDSDGIVTSWNSGLVGITGYSAAEVVNTRHLGLLRARDAAGRDVLVERWQQTIDSTGLPAELQIVTSTGQSVWLSCSYSRIPAAEGRREVLVVVARNITQARELERLKDDFVAVVSHELRTPLVPIKGWAQTLINRGDRLTDDQRRTAVQSILSQAQKLESLVLNILEASRIESGRVDSEGLADVAAITLRIVEDTLSARPDRCVRVRPPTVPCQVRGSAVWVERAVANLVANAVKYSPDDEPVDVAITVENNEVSVAVTDRGPGIANDSQERIFERFERLEETRTQTGTGLGLYITRRLARAMGGDVSVSSVPGAGSTFLLRLPVAPVTRLPEQRPANDANVVNLR